MNQTKCNRVSTLLYVCLILSALFLNACAVLNKLPGVEVKPPQVSFTSAKLTGLSFDQADFMFDFNIRNPNALGVKLAGFDYDFLINSGTFIKGNQNHELEIPANGENSIQLPLSLNFADLYKTFQSLKNQNRSTYQLNCGFAFNVPVLGVVRVPVSKAGEFPAIKRPSINLSALKLKSLGFSGAKLGLEIKFKNPNAFSMLLEHFQYQFDVNGKSWVVGDAKKQTQVPEKGESVIEIPISLNFLQIGQSAYQLLKGGQRVNYQFQGNLDLATSVPLLEKFKLSFDREGLIEISQ